MTSPHSLRYVSDTCGTASPPNRAHSCVSLLLQAIGEGEKGVAVEEAVQRAMKVTDGTSISVA